MALLHTADWLDLPDSVRSVTARAFRHSVAADPPCVEIFEGYQVSKRRTSEYRSGGVNEQNKQSVIGCRRHGESICSVG